jgi:hypothetical protein
MGGESGRRSASRRHSWTAMSRRRERVPRSQPPDWRKGRRERFWDRLLVAPEGFLVPSGAQPGPLTGDEGRAEGAGDVRFGRD